MRFRERISRQLGSGRMRHRERSKRSCMRDNQPKYLGLRSGWKSTTGWSRKDKGLVPQRAGHAPPTFICGLSATHARSSYLVGAVIQVSCCQITAHANAPSYPSVGAPFLETKEKGRRSR